ncbi:hypothetical protein [Variovorax paradoxus]|uniref:hypothetical protein n=1 Tax=Variovorax paradoxus TaxID=34073 RepID=UPI003ECC691E
MQVRFVLDQRVLDIWALLGVQRLDLRSELPRVQARQLIFLDGQKRIVPPVCIVRRAVLVLIATREAAIVSYRRPLTCGDRRSLFTDVGHFVDF